MARGRTVVAFEWIESAQGRMWRELSGGHVERDARGRAKKVGLGRYWCAADKPTEDDTFRLAPVYRTQEVPEDAECEACHINIRELQKAMAL